MPNTPCDPEAATVPTETVNNKIDGRNIQKVREGTDGAASSCWFALSLSIERNVTQTSSRRVIPVSLQKRKKRRFHLIMVREYELGRREHSSGCVKENGSKRECMKAVGDAVINGRVVVGRSPWGGLQGCDD
jgi:hypothetical protein